MSFVIFIAETPFAFCIDIISINRNQGITAQTINLSIAGQVT